MPKFDEVPFYHAAAVPKCTFKNHINTVLILDSVPNYEIRMIKIFIFSIHFWEEWSKATSRSIYTRVIISITFLQSVQGDWTIAPTDCQSRFGVWK